jgi:hypothetical protein
LNVGGADAIDLALSADVYEDEPETQPALVGGAYRPLLFQVTNISVRILP